MKPNEVKALAQEQDTARDLAVLLRLVVTLEARHNRIHPATVESLNAIADRIVKVEASRLMDEEIARHE